MVAQTAIIRKVGAAALMKYTCSSKKGFDFAQATTGCEVSTRTPAPVPVAIIMAGVEDAKHRNINN
jgi:hypothetical protein